WITVGIPFYVFGQAMNPIIRADGNPRFAMFATLIGCIANIILDPTLIYGFHMGMTGAAVATVAGQVLTMIASIWYLKHMRALSLTKESFVMNWQSSGRMLTLGITSFLSQIALVAAMAAVNSTIQKYTLLDPIFGQEGYTQIPMAVVGIVMKYFQVVISVAVGTAAGCAPIAAYNTGAGRNDRVKKLFGMMLKTELIAGLIFLAIAALLPGQIMNLFGAANESEYYREFAMKAFRVYLCLLPLATINKGTFIYLQALGKAFLSSMLSLIREVVLGVALPILLPIWFGLDGILYSMPCCDIITFAISVVMIRMIYRQLKDSPASEHAAETRTAD
ncbi:MAG: MATE family efflux transporter, partial [Bulleidia sp.]